MFVGSIEEEEEALTQMGDTGRPYHAANAKIGDGSVGSGSSTGEEVVEDVDLARSGESVTVANHKVGETQKGYKLPNFDKDKDKDKDKDAQSSLDETKEKRMKTSNNDQRIESRVFRFDGSETEVRNLSPGVEIKGPNQRPAAAAPAAVICDFYAKGWCIKGSTCRFLHVKDSQKNNLTRVEKDVLADCKREVRREGLVEHGQESRPSNHFPEMPKFMSLKREEMFALSSKDAGNEIKRQSGSINDYGNHGSLAYGDGSLLRDRFHPEYAVSSSHKFGNHFSQSRGVEEMASFQHIRAHNYRVESLTRDSSSSSSSTSVSATGAHSLNNISAWTGSLLPFSYSSISTTRLDSMPPSLHHSSSHFSGSKPDNLPPAKRKISSNDWEPSVPFRPSFLIRSMISIPGSLYDPLRDSVESPKVGDASLKPSFHCQGSSIENASVHQNSGEVVSDTRGLARNDDTMSVSSHNTNYGKDMRTTEEEVVGTSTAFEYRAMMKQENSLGSSAVKDITESTSDIRKQNQGPGKSVVEKEDSLRKNNHSDAGSNLDQSVSKESRELRHFRVALIDFVKELLKPKWLDGHISKAAHNKIVKKAVEKVLGTLPLEQVPTSMESVQQYLALSRGKIDKLVQGYAEIYGKI